MTPHAHTGRVIANPRIERAAILGTGIGLLVGSLAMWPNDPKTATTGTTSGLVILLLVLVTAKPNAKEPSA